MEFISMRLCFFSAEIYNSWKKQIRPSHYTKIIFNHEDSIFVEARKTSGKGDINL
jgi:hypothetical protein